MNKTEIEAIEKQTNDQLIRVPQKDRINLVRRLSDKYCKNYDTPILNDNIKEFAKQIKALNKDITCIPVGCYSWCGSTIEFNADIETALESNDILKDYHKDGRYTEYISPEFTDDMTKGTWKTIVSLWENIIQESMLLNGNDHNCDYVENNYYWLLIYDIEKEEFVKLDEL